MNVNNVHIKRIVIIILNNNNFKSNLFYIQIVNIVVYILHHQTKNNSWEQFEYILNM